MLIKLLPQLLLGNGATLVKLHPILYLDKQQVAGEASWLWQNSQGHTFSSSDKQFNSDPVGKLRAEEQSEEP